MDNQKSDSNSGSVTRWIQELQKGDEAAAELLWDFLKSRLVSLASRQVGFSIAYDRDDIALDAFATLCAGIREGRYDIEDRNALWSLLAVITINGARKRARVERTLRRGGGHRRVAQSDEQLKSIAADSLSPEESFFAREECTRLLGILPNEELKHLALLKVDGHTNEEIAKVLGCTRRSIQRRLNLIRKIWTDELNE